MDISPRCIRVSSAPARARFLRSHLDTPRRTRGPRAAAVHVAVGLHEQPNFDASTGDSRGAAGCRIDKGDAWDAAHPGRLHEHLVGDAREVTAGFLHSLLDELTDFLGDAQTNRLTFRHGSHCS